MKVRDLENLLGQTRDLDGFASLITKTVCQNELPVSLKPWVSYEEIDGSVLDFGMKIHHHKIEAIFDHKIVLTEDAIPALRGRFRFFDIGRFDTNEDPFFQFTFNDVGATELSISTGYFNRSQAMTPWTIQEFTMQILKAFHAQNKDLNIS